MEKVESASKPGYFSTYTIEGDTYIVLDGLTPQLVHKPGKMESFMSTHYDFFAFLYVGILTIMFVYLIGMYIVIPLYLRAKRGLPLFLEQ